MEKALAEGTMDARLFTHAGVLAARLGRTAEAGTWLTKARSLQRMLLPSEHQQLAATLAALATRATLDPSIPPGHKRFPLAKTNSRKPHQQTKTNIGKTNEDKSNHTHSSLSSGDGAARRSARIQSHGRAAHHPRSVGQHHRRLRLRGRRTATKKYLVVALGVYPHEEPGIGPNKYNFDDNVLYEIHVATGRDLAAGKPTISYQFEFNTTFKNEETILVSYLGVVNDVADAAQNLVQTYTVTKVELALARPSSARAVVPPNNQGNATPFYNQGDNGENPAKDGVSTSAELDRYTQQAITELDRTATFAFAGQRDDGFYADVQSVFDLLQWRSAQPRQGLAGWFQSPPDGVENSDRRNSAATSRLSASMPRPAVRSSRSCETKRRRQEQERRARVMGTGARQGNPLFNEALVAMADKDRYSRTSPSEDARLFSKYALNPELAQLLNAGIDDIPAIETNRTDIAGIYIPDLIKVDLSTPGVRFAGSGPDHPTNPDDPGFSRLSIFGGDVLQSEIQDPFGNGGSVPGGWPNGRRFGDDVVDIAVTALISDLRGPRSYSRVGGRRSRPKRHRLQQDLPLRGHAAERPQPRASLSNSRFFSVPGRESGLQLQQRKRLGRFRLARVNATGKDHSRGWQAG